MHRPTHDVLHNFLFSNPGDEVGAPRRIWDLERLRIDSPLCLGGGTLCFHGIGRNARL